MTMPTVATVSMTTLFLLATLFGLACGEDVSSDLIAFVGQRIEVKSVANTPPPSEPGTIVIVLDQKFEARYKVLTVLFGTYDQGEIEFTAYDHYGRPAFEKYDTVMLYVSRHDGRLFHQKYQFHDVYRTADGRWAGCGDPYQREPVIRQGAVRATSIDFRPKVTFDVSGLTQDEVRARYPSQYFTRSGDVVTCVAGAYAEQLFEVKRQGVLKARGLFK